LFEPKRLSVDTASGITSGTGYSMKLAALAGVLCLLMVGCTETSLQELAFANGLAAYERGEFTEARKIFKPLAKEHHPEAAYFLGEMHVYAQGVPQDYLEAYHWYLIGGRYGNPRAQMVLASLFDGGLGVAKNPRRSLEWFQCVYENEKSSRSDKSWANLYLTIAYWRDEIIVECRL